IFSRMIAAECGISFKEIDQNIIFDDSNKKLVDSTLYNLSKLPIGFSENARVNIHDIRAKVEKLKKKSGLDLLIIDYLQLIESTPGGSKNKTRENEVSKISRGIKLIAMELKI